MQRAFWVGSWNTRDIPGKLAHSIGICTWADTVVPGAPFLILGTGRWFWEMWALGVAWWRAMGTRFYVPLFISPTFKNKMLIKESTQLHGVVPVEPGQDGATASVSLSGWGRIPICPQGESFPVFVLESWLPGAPVWSLWESASPRTCVGRGAFFTGAKNVWFPWGGAQWARSSRVGVSGMAAGGVLGCPWSFNVIFFKEKFFIFIFLEIFNFYIFKIISLFLYDFVFAYRLRTFPYLKGHSLISSSSFIFYFPHLGPCGICFHTAWGQDHIFFPLAIQLP